MLFRSVSQSRYSTIEEENLNPYQVGSKRGWETKTGLKKQPGHFTLKFGFKKKRKIQQFLTDFGSYKEFCEYTDCRPEYRLFGIRNVPPSLVDKDLSRVFDITNFSQTKARAFLSYLVKWDGFKAGKGYGYSNTNKASVDFVQQVQLS